MEQVIQSNTRNTNVIIGISVVIPLAVAALILLPQKIDAGSWVYFLPDLNAVINSLTSVLLILAFVMIKRGNIAAHRTLMLSGLVLGFIFLLSYIVYHASVDSVKFGDLNADGVLSEAEKLQVGGTRSIYLFFLASHILLSIVVVPFVLFAFYFALSGKIERHKKIVKFTFPVWLYVSVTGVIVYFMISQYYPW